MKVLFYACHARFYDHISILLDEALCLHNEGHEVIFAYNDCSMGICTGNLEKNSYKCKVCHEWMQKDLKLLPKSIKQVNIQDYWVNSKHHFDYATSDQIKKLEYRDVKIGYAVMASYISMTRNLTPAINEESKKYFDKLIDASCNLTDALEKLIDEVKPDKMYFFNSRFLEWRPPYDLARTKGIDAVALERTNDPGSHNCKVRFVNRTPHNIRGVQDMCDTIWEEVNLPEEEKKRIGVDFYERRRAGVAANDKVYTGLQKQGQLPCNWDDSKVNIVIFNSSEDEYASIGDEYDSHKLFPTQYQGMKFIFESLQNLKNVHVYVRIHPNLARIPYRYHTELQTLGDGYDNVTIIPAKDSISSYTLMDKAEKVVVFGSTMGQEAVYWGKPVILLAGACYYYSNICYLPKSEKELKDMLLAKLQPMDNFEAIKWGFYFMYRNPEDRSKYIDIDSSTFKICGVEFFDIHNLKLLGSSKLYAIYQKVRNKIHKIRKKINPKIETSIPVPYEEDMNAEL